MIPLWELKAHLRITHQTDDEYIESLEEAAVSIAVDSYGWAETVVIDDLGAVTVIPIPAKVHQAVRMLVAHWYTNRIPVADGQSDIPQPVRDLLWRPVIA